MRDQSDQLVHSHTIPTIQQDTPLAQILHPRWGWPLIYRSHNTESHAQ